MNTLYIVVLYSLWVTLWGIPFIWFLSGFKVNSFRRFTSHLWLAPAIGVIVSSIAYSLKAWYFNSPELAVYSVYIIGVLLSVVSWFVIRSVTSSFAFSYSPKHNLVVWGGVGVLILYLLPNLAILSDQLFLSANLDIFDVIGKATQLFNGERLDLPLKPGRRMEFSNLAMLYGIFGGDKIVLYNSSTITFILIAYLSYYWLLQRVFRFSRKAAVYNVLIFLSSNFVYSTYLASHRGSILYVALVSVTVGGLILLITEKNKLQYLLLSLLSIYFLQTVYKDAVLVPIFIITIWGIWEVSSRYLYPVLQKKLAAYWLPGKKAFLSFFLFSVLAVTLVLGFLLLSESIRMSFGIYRIDTAWKVADSLLIFPISIGVIPSIVFGAEYLGSFLLRLDFYYYLILAASFVFLLLYVLAVYRFYSSSGRIRFFLFALLLLPILFFLAHNYFRDPYYTYKMIYTNYFFILSPIIVVSMLAFRKRYISQLLRIPIIALLFLNLYWNYYGVLEIAGRPYHKTAGIDELISVAKKIGDNIYFQVEDIFQKSMLQYYLKSKGYSQFDLEISPGSISEYSHIGRFYDIPPVVDYPEIKQFKAYENKSGFLVEKPLDFPIVHYRPKPGLTSSPIVFNERAGLYVGIRRNIRAQKLSEIVQDGLEVLEELHSRHIFGMVLYPGVGADVGYAIIKNANDKSFLFEETNSGHPPVLWCIKPEYRRALNGEKGVIDLTGGEVIGETRFFEFKKLSDDWVELLSFVNDRNTKKLVQDIKNETDSISIDIGANSLYRYWLYHILQKEGIKIVAESNYSLNLRLPDTFVDPDMFIPFSYASDSSIAIYKANDQTGHLNLHFIHHRGKTKKKPAENWSNLSMPPEAGAFLWSDFNLSIINPEATINKYVSLVITPGFSTDFSAFDLKVWSNQTDTTLNFTVNYPNTRVLLPMNLLLDSLSTQKSAPLIYFLSNAPIGNDPLPYAQNMVHYMVIDGRIVDSPSDDYLQIMHDINQTRKIDFSTPLMQALSERSHDAEEIISHNQKNVLHLLEGWMPLEYFNDESFRWISATPASIQIDHAQIKNCSLELLLEPLTPGVELRISDGSGKILTEEVLHGRTQISIGSFPADSTASMQSSKIFFEAQIDEDKKIKIDDPRNLMVRFFSLKLKAN